jgi:hypothetical protein
MPRIVVELAKPLVEKLIQEPGPLGPDGTRAQDYASLGEVARGLGLQQLARILDASGNPESKRLIEGTIKSQIERRPASRDLVGFFAIEVKDPAVAEKLLSELESLPREVIASAEFEATYRGAGMVTALTPPKYRGAQAYLEALGVDKFPNDGDWHGIGFADMEHGWNLDHESLCHLMEPTEPPVFPNAFQNMAHNKYAPHGTSVLGICVGGGKGKIQGIADGATLKALLYPAEDLPFARTIYELVDSELLSAGDILLIELEQNGGQSDTGLPVEVKRAMFKAIRFAVDQGIVVIAAAGDGHEPDGRRVGWDLDVVIREDADKDRKKAPAWATDSEGETPDSGAVLVSGCVVPADKARPTEYDADVEFNVGTKIDCYGWGSAVLTGGANDPPAGYGVPKTDDPDFTYDCNFSQTSAAAAMVAGVALVTQRLACHVLNRRLEPGELRKLLRDVRSGTPVKCQGKPTRVVPHLPSIYELLPELGATSR